MSSVGVSSQQEESVSGTRQPAHGARPIDHEYLAFLATINADSRAQPAPGATAPIPSSAPTSVNDDDDTQARLLNLRELADRERGLPSPSSTSLPPVIGPGQSRSVVRCARSEVDESVLRRLAELARQREIFAPSPPTAAPSRRWDEAPQGAAPPGPALRAWTTSWSVPPMPPRYPPPGMPPGMPLPPGMRPPGTSPALAFLSRKSWHPHPQPPAVAAPDEPMPCTLCGLYIDLMYLDDESGPKQEGEGEPKDKEAKASEGEGEGVEQSSEKGEKEQSAAMDLEEDSDAMEIRLDTKDDEKEEEEKEEKEEPTYLQERNAWSTLPCHCKVCRECFARYVSTRCDSVGLTIFRNTAVPFACPGCGRGMPVETTFPNLGPALRERVDSLALKQALSRMSDLRYCPAPDCGNAMWAGVEDYEPEAPPTEADNDDDADADRQPAPVQENPLLRGPPQMPGLAPLGAMSLPINRPIREPCRVIACDREGCGTEFCFECRQTWHEGMTCEESRQAREAAEDYLALATATASTAPEGEQPSAAEPAIIGPIPAPTDGITTRVCKEWLRVKPCPRCSNEVEKNGGCNHMTCVCGFEYCWECLNPFWGPHKPDCPTQPRRRERSRERLSPRRSVSPRARSRSPARRLRRSPLRSPRRSPIRSRSRSPRMRQETRPRSRSVSRSRSRSRSISPRAGPSRGFGFRSRSRSISRSRSRSRSRSPARNRRQYEDTPAQLWTDLGLSGQAPTDWVEVLERLPQVESAVARARSAALTAIQRYRRRSRSRGRSISNSRSSRSRSRSRSASPARYREVVRHARGRSTNIRKRSRSRSVSSSSSRSRSRSPNRAKRNRYRRSRSRSPRRGTAQVVSYRKRKATRRDASRSPPVRRDRDTDRSTRRFKERSRSRSRSSSRSRSRSRSRSPAYRSAKRNRASQSMRISSRSGFGRASVSIDSNRNDRGNRYPRPF